MSMGTALKWDSKTVRKSLRPGERCAKVIAVAAQKGGVGKTTTTVSLASAWARYHGKKVLVLDLDPQAHVNLALRDQVLLGGGPLSELLVEQTATEVEEIVTQTSIPNLFVTPSDPGLGEAQDRMASRIGKELVLRSAIEITRSYYDLIVIDCPPNVDTLTVNALVAADHVLIPANLAALAMSGVTGLLETVCVVREHLNPGLEILGVVVTRMDGRNRRSNDSVLSMVQESWGDLLIPAHIGVNDALSQAQMAGQDIYAYQPGSRGAKQYRELAACVLDRLDTI